MPASLFHENSEQINQNIQNSNVNNVNGLEEQRALQLALELSMLGLMNDEDSHLNAAIDAEARLKKSQNTTECVPVPSSEHVAEIVGRQGCKIKALRAKTNAYIKTPVRGEEPVFVVTGRKEDVNSAKREILSAADHFSQIRAQRKNTLVGANGSANGLTSNICNATGQCTIQVRVPYRVVGLVVGPKGATIKRIQQQTSTYIITPSREKEPMFEVTGLPDNVQTARKEIEAHIAIRTGDVIDSGSSGNGSSQADDLDTRDYLNNSPQQFGSFVEQLYGNVNSNGSNSGGPNSANVAAKLNNIQNLNGLQLLTQSSQTNNGGSGASFNHHNIFAAQSSLSNGGGHSSNGLSSLYSKANGLENSFSPFALNALAGATNNKSPDIVESHSMFSNFGVDALARTNLLTHSTSQNNGAPNTLNGFSSGNSSSASSNGNLNTSNILNNLCNGSGLSMLNLQNAKNLLNVNSKFADIYSQLLANGNSNVSNAPSNQLLQQQHSISNAAAAVVNQLNLSNGLAQLSNNSNGHHSVNGVSAANAQQQSNGSNLNSSNNGHLANGGNSYNVNSLYERDEGLGDSPTFDSIAAANLASLTNSLAAQIANVNTSTSSTSSQSSGLGSSNGLITNGNSSSASSVNSTTSANGVSLWPDFSGSPTSGSPSATSSMSNSNNSTTNNGSPTSTVPPCSNLVNSSSTSPNAFDSSQSSPNSALSTSIITAQQVSRA